MHGRSGWMAILAGIALTSLAACGGGAAPVFRPAGSAPPIAQSATLGTAVTTAPGGYRFPAGVSIRFTSPLPSSPARRAIVDGYRGYVLALWAAVLSHGRDAAYQQLASGNALAFVHREVSYFASHHERIVGTIRYSGTTVTHVYFGTGATVTSCVDASAFRATGARAGPVFPPRFAHYLEDVAEGRHTGGTWVVAHTQSYPSSTGEGAACR